MKHSHGFTLISIFLIASGVILVAGAGLYFFMPRNGNSTHAEQKTETLQGVASKIETYKIETPGFTELVDAKEGVVAALSRDRVIKVVDIADPKKPVVSGTIATPNFAEAIFEKNGVFYVADNRELRIMNDPLGTPISIYPLGDFWPSAETVENGYAYLASGSELLILDVRNPKSVQHMSRIKLTGRAPSHVTVKNGYAYVVFTLGGLNIVDVKNPKKPVVMQVIQFESHTVGFHVEGQYAYIGRVASTTSTSDGYSQVSVFEVIDISKPGSAKVIGSVSIPTNIKELAIQGSYAYVLGSYPYRVSVIDLAVPAKPALIPTKESIEGGAELLDIVIDGTFAFIADGIAGIRILDISNPVQPVFVKDVPLDGSASTVYRSGKKIYVVLEQKYFSLADVKNPKKPKLTYTEPFSASYGYTSIVLSNKNAYFNGGGAHIYDIANLVSPVHINKESAAEIDSIQIQGNYLYSTIGEIGLLVYDVTNPAKPIKISQTPFPAGIPRNVSVDGIWAAGISNSPYSITVFNISDPKKPVPGQSYLYKTYPQAVTVSNGYAYVARGGDGVDIIKINADGSLKLVKNISVKGSAHRVAIVGKRAFIVRDGADIYDISDPSKPKFLTHVNNKGEAYHLAVSNGWIYIADGGAGVTIVPEPKW